MTPLANDDERIMAGVRSVERRNKYRRTKGEYVKRRREWKSGHTLKSSTMPRTSHTSIPFTPPMECLPVARIPEGEGWIYEILCDPLHKNSNVRERRFLDPKNQKLRNRKSLALVSTFSRIAGSGSMRAISTAPIIVEKIEKKARSLSAVRCPGIKGTIRSL